METHGQATKKICWQSAGGFKFPGRRAERTTLETGKEVSEITANTPENGTSISEMREHRKNNGQS